MIILNLLLMGIYLYNTYNYIYIHYNLHYFSDIQLQMRYNVV